MAEPKATEHSELEGQCQLMCFVTFCDSLGADYIENDASMLNLYNPARLPIDI